MNDKSQAIDSYRTWMTVFMILVGIGGCVLAYTSSRVYNSYYFTTGGYYTTNWVVSISYLVSTGVTILLLRAICNVTCECFNNVYAIRKTLDNNQMEDNQTESTTNNTDLSENQEQNSDTPQENLDKESDENEK